MKLSFDIFIILVRSTITGSFDELPSLLPLPATIWKEVYQYSKENRLLGLTFDALRVLNKEISNETGIETELLMRWYGMSSLANKKYASTNFLSNEFAKEARKAGLRCIVLKGQSVSCYYTNPIWRDSGDLDIYLGKDYERGNEFARSIGAEVDTGTYKHSHIHYKGLMIENHRYLTEFGGTKNGKTLEKLLEFCIDREPLTQLELDNMYRPSAHFNALFLTKHSMVHFFSEGLPFRYIYDWAMFLKTEGNSIDWKQTYSEMEKCNLRNFADVMIRICVEKLGLQLPNSSITISSDGPLVKAFIDDLMIFNKGFSSNESNFEKVGRIFKRIYYRLWKFRKLNNESFVIAIWKLFAFNSYLHRKIEL